MSSTAVTRPTSTASGPQPIALAFLGAAVPSVLACLIIATIGRAAGVSKEFKPLEFGSYAFLAVLGVLIGAIGWSIVRRRSGDPAGLLRTLVPAVLGVSLVPDILVGAGGNMAHTTWGGVSALIVMHLAVAACAVASYSRFLPVRSR